MPKRLKLYFCITLLVLLRSGLALSERDATTNKTELVLVEPGVRLEVVDWGGSGAPIIFLAGAGDTAHRFDNFAPQFTNHHHVYGITRRGTGASSSPAPASGNYTADHLGDDVLAVIKALGIRRPVLVGHSLAGQELSSIGSRFPDKVAGLVYLDAATGFAFYDPAHPPIEIEMNDLKGRINEIEAGGVDEQKELLDLEALLRGSKPFFTRTTWRSRRCRRYLRVPPSQQPSTLGWRSTHIFPFRCSRSTPAPTTGIAYRTVNVKPP